MNRPQRGLANVAATVENPGVAGPVTLVPRDANPEAMFFSVEAFPTNITEIISWLGSSFYALTTGKEIKINGAKISREIDPGASVLDNLVIVIDNSDNGTDLVVAVPGNWIVRQQRTGYQVFTQEQLDESWLCSNV